MIPVADIAIFVEFTGDIIKREGKYHACVLADDEDLELFGIEKMLSDMPLELEICGTARNGRVKSAGFWNSAPM